MAPMSTAVIKGGMTISSKKNIVVSSSLSNLLEHLGLL
jgi:hypothetical protein